MALRCLCLSRIHLSFQGRTLKSHTLLSDPIENTRVATINLFSGPREKEGIVLAPGIDLGPNSGLKSSDREAPKHAASQKQSS